MNETDFIAAYDDYADAIFRHCALRLGDREIAKELMQDTFMKTWKYIADGKKIDNIRAFLYRTANNLIIDYVRRQKLRTETSLEDLQEKGFDIGTDDDAQAMKTKFDGQQVVDILQKVEEPYRTAVVMRHIDGLPPKEIAKALKVSANVVSVRINRGMKQLESLLPTNE